MHGKSEQDDVIPAPIQEILRDFFSAIRAVKLYPPNNPVYSQSVTKSHKTLEQNLQAGAEFRIEVQKAGFFYNRMSIDKDMGFYRGVAGDLFTKGARVISFTPGINEQELEKFYTIISLPPDDIKHKGGMEAILWQAGITHIRIQEADLDRVIPDVAENAAVDIDSLNREQAELLKRDLSGKSINVSGKKIVLSELADNPEAFGASAVNDSQKQGDTKEAREEHLLELYREIGRQVLEMSYEQREFLFRSLAKSVFAMNPGARDEFISHRLYPEFDRQSLQRHLKDIQEQTPHELHEIVSARFSRSWTMPQVSSLLEKVSNIPSQSGQRPVIMDLPGDLPAIARELAEYSPEEIETIKKITESIQEGEMLLPFVATLIQLIPWVLHPLPSMPSENTVQSFSRIIDLLDEMISLLLEKKQYQTAVMVLQVFRKPVDPGYQPYLTAAIKKAGSKKRINDLIRALRTIRKDSADYAAITSFFTILDRNATPILLENLAEEEDRSMRRLLIQILKDLGKNQIAFLGGMLSDGRWYFVRNIVNILGESRKEEAIAYLKNVANHPNFQIRQEIVKSLVTIGGKKAAELIVQFMKDPDIDIRFIAIRGLGTISIPGGKAEEALLDFLKSRLVRKIDHALRLEAVESLGKIGGREAARFLGKFSRVRWWRARKPQVELRAYAEKAVREITRRVGDAG